MRSSRTRQLTDAFEKRSGKSHDGGDGIRRRDDSGVRDQNGVTQTERDAVDELHRQYPHGVGDHRIQVKPDGEREQAQGHAMPVTDAFDEPTGKEQKRHLAADALYSDGQAL